MIATVIVVVASPAGATRRRTVEGSVVIPQVAIPRHGCSGEFAYQSINGATVTVSVGNRVVDRSTLGPGVGDTNYQCRFPYSLHLPSAAKYSITVAGYDPIRFSTATLRNAGWEANIRIGDSPTGPPNDLALSVFAGKPCSIAGDTIRKLTQSGLSVPYSNQGMTCTGGRWTWVVDVESTCGFGAAPAQSAAGTALRCINGHYLADGQPLTRFGEGHYAVGTGTGQIPPGTYVAMNVVNCYWERVDNTGRIIDNNFISGAPRAEFTVADGDSGVNIDNCSWGPA